MSGQLARAREFARLAHLQQQYGGGGFHENHLQQVVATLEGIWRDQRTFGANSATTSPIWFGDSRTKPATSGARHRKTHAKIRQRPEAVRIKLADRIANVQASEEQNRHLFGMYRSEQRQFRRKLYRAGEWEDMWSRLDRLLGVR